MKCRNCKTELDLIFVDLGSAPPSNSYLTDIQLRKPERWYPLRVLVCSHCWLVQSEYPAEAGEIFSENYAYFSSYSSSWLKHAEQYIDEVVERFRLNADSLVVEIAANDGYLLQYVMARKIPCFGIEPTASTANSAKSKGIKIIEEFFDVKLAKKLTGEGSNADMIIANNVLAHVPDINNFVAGVTLLLKPEGIVSFEFPHLFNLVEKCQFDTIYHEHYSYLSLTVVESIFRNNGLVVFDVEEILTHGGSLRVFACRTENKSKLQSESVKELLMREESTGMTTPDYYQGFQSRADKIKNDFLGFLLKAKYQGLKTIAYGAAAKGNTLLNYAGVRPDLLPYVVDRNSAKQGKFLPGSHISIVAEEKIHTDRPDCVIILPWNIKQEVMKQLDFIREWNGQFVTVIPELETV